eukprot:14747596-Alexandrium_andersonii.AAC.1
MPPWEMATPAAVLPVFTGWRRLQSGWPGRASSASTSSWPFTRLSAADSPAPGGSGACGLRPAPSGGRRRLGRRGRTWGDR